jgi:hypothetical protein
VNRAGAEPQTCHAPAAMALVPCPPPRGPKVHGILGQVPALAPQPRHTDRPTGLEQRAWLFVAVWPYSANLYVEATRPQTSADWLGAHVGAIEAFGCAPRALVPDNCSTAVKKALRYDPQFNTSYAELAEYYCLAVLPARVRKPRDKGAVESGVLQAERAVLVGLRIAKFFSLADLNAAIQKAVATINAELFQKRDGCRDSVFEIEEKPVARPYQRGGTTTPTQRSALDPPGSVHRSRSRLLLGATLVGQRVDARLGANPVGIFQRAPSSPPIRAQPVATSGCLSRRIGRQKAAR